MKTKKSRAQKDEVISCYCFVLFFSPWSEMLDLGHIGIPIGKRILLCHCPVPVKPTSAERRGIKLQGEQDRLLGFC